MVLNVDDFKLVSGGIVRDFFPNEILAFELFSEEKIYELAEGIDITIVNEERSKGEFEFGNSKSEYLNFVGLLNGIFSALVRIYEESQEGNNVDVSTIFENSLEYESFEKSLISDIWVKHEATLISLITT